MKKTKMFIISIILLMIILVAFIGINIKDGNVNTLNNNTIYNNKTLAVMIQDGKSGYIESESNIWPSNMFLNEDLTNCVDKNGNKVEVDISYVDGNIIMKANKKVYCYLYFNQSIGDYLLTSNTEIASLNNEIEGGMYRFQGIQDEVQDNYICFGTSNKEECINDEESHMYRIIGTTEEGKVKLIKKTSIGEFHWYSSDSSDKTWPNSVPYSKINGSAYLTNTTYVPNRWINKISYIDWKYGNLTNSNQEASLIYATEEGWSTTVTAKIGLMSLTDYYYSQQEGGKNCATEQGETVYSTCKYAWIHLSHNDTDVPDKNSDLHMYPADELIMSRYGKHSNGYYYLTYIDSNGRVSINGLAYIFSIRPVFYLGTNAEYLSGTGTLDDPYLIK